MNSKRQKVATGITDKRLLARKKQEDVAKLLNVSVSTVGNWEHGFTDPNITCIWTLADLYNCSIDELVGRDTS